MGDTAMTYEFTKQTCAQCEEDIDLYEDDYVTLKTKVKGSSWEHVQCYGLARAQRFKAQFRIVAKMKKGTKVRPASVLMRMS